MSSIKTFRGKTTLSFEELNERGIKHENGWVYGAYLDGYILTGILEANDEYVTIESWVSVEINSVGQNTGAKDKNGKEIYRGDYLYGPNFLFPVPDTRTLLVFWSNDVGGYQLNVFDLDNCEVVGNLQDNPELSNK